MSKAFRITIEIEVFENETEEQAIAWVKDNLHEDWIKEDLDITAKEIDYNE